MEDIDSLITRAERCFEARANMIAMVIKRLGLEKTMFEASNSKNSEWFIKQYGVVNVVTGDA